jgi:hypothetical protein
MKDSDRWLIIANIWLAGASLALDGGAGIFTFLAGFHWLLFIVAMFGEK